MLELQTRPRGKYLLHEACESHIAHWHLVSVYVSHFKQLQQAGSSGGIRNPFWVALLDCAGKFNHPPTGRKAKSHSAGWKRWVSVCVSRFGFGTIRRNLRNPHPSKNHSACNNDPLKTRCPFTYNLRPLPYPNGTKPSNPTNHSPIRQPAYCLAGICRNSAPSCWEAGWRTWKMVWCIMLLLLLLVSELGYPNFVSITFHRSICYRTFRWWEEQLSRLLQWGFETGTANTSGRFLLGFGSILC